MRKEELRALRDLPATKEMMEKGKRFQEVEKEQFWDHKKYLVIIPEYEVLFRVQNLKQYIKVAVFLPEDMRKNIKTPRYEIFINVKGEEYITRELDGNGKEVRWSSAMLGNLNDVPVFGYYSNTKYFISKDGMDTLNHLVLEKEGTKKKRGAYRLQAWQQEQKDKDTKRKEEREVAPWDADMKLIPEIPKGFKEWMRKDACRDFFIIYEYKRKGANEGFCSRCRKMVPIKNPKHGKETKCPACKAEAVFKSEGKIKTLGIEEYYAEMMQKINGGIVVRGFRQKQWYRDKDYKEPGIYTEEWERIFIFENGVHKRYVWESYKNKYMRWCLDKEYFPKCRGTTYWERRTKLYKRNFAQLKKTSILKQSAIDLWPVLPLKTTNYLAAERGNPAVEMLAKMGMFRLAKGIIDQTYDEKLMKQDETEIAKLLRIDKSRMKRLKDMDGNINHLRWMQLEKKENTIWPEFMIKTFGEAGILPNDFRFLKAKISYEKCCNYLNKQASMMGDSMCQTLITWRDYTDMAKNMKMNTEIEQIAKPKNLKEAHDRLVLMSKSKGIEKQAEELEKKWPKVNGQLPKLQKFEFEYGDYCIVAPRNITDIVTEGEILGHCVHTCDYYFERIQSDETYLFFLRKKCSPDMPWYTLEVEPSGNIRQKRTTGDKQNKDFEKAVPFLKKWQQYFKEKLTKEEKELGEMSNILRKKEYRKLREDGNKVWHGPLAGKLLADVLEADFMEAI